MRYFSIIFFYLAFCQCLLLKAQSDKQMDVAINEATFKEFTKKVEILFGAHFYYDAKETDSLKITVAINKTTLKQLLTTVFAKVNFQFAVDDKNRVFISKQFKIVTNLPTGLFERRMVITDSLIASNSFFSDELETKDKLKNTNENRLFAIGNENNETSQKNAVLAGYIKDIKSGETIAGATLQVDSTAGFATTDQFCYYSISMPKGKHELKISSAGMTHAIDFGINSTYYQLKPGSFNAVGSQSLVKNNVAPNEQASESALFIGDQITISPKFSVNAGLRYSLFNYFGAKELYQYVDGSPRTIYTITDSSFYSAGKIIKTYSAPEVRLSLRYALNDKTSIKASYNTLVQFIHLLSNTTAISPTDIWKLSDTYIKPQTGDQFSVINTNLLNATYTLRDSVKLKINTTVDSTAQTAADLSMSVFLLDSLQLEKYIDIQSYLLLNSDLIGKIESPDYYLNNLNKDAELAVDNLMLTQGWSRFKWENILQDKTAYFQFLPEYEGLLLNAKITDKTTGLPIKNATQYKFS